MLVAVGSDTSNLVIVLYFRSLLISSYSLMTRCWSWCRRSIEEWYFGVHYIRWDNVGLPKVWFLRFDLVDIWSIIHRYLAVTTRLSTWTVIGLCIHRTLIQKLGCYETLAFATLLVFKLDFTFLVISWWLSMRLSVHWLPIVRCIGLCLVLLHLSILLVDIVNGVFLVL